MKKATYSKIEKKFLKTALEERKRLDGRRLDERRCPKIHFGKEYGSCHVSLGDTRVLAQVSSEITQPKSTRPNEGLVYVNVEFSPMSAEHVEPGKPSDACIEVNAVLEKCIRESKSVDLESLCIIAEEKVWTLRVDLTVLNIEGNVIECASIAALAALAHYRRPDVTSTGDRLIIHEASDKEPLKTSLHHFPICLTYAIFNKGRHIVADPTLIEEQCAEARLSVGMNAYRELCGIHLGGQALTDHQSILKVVQKAAVSATEIVQLIKKTLLEDEEARSKNEVVGFVACIRAGRITTVCNQRMKVRINPNSIQETAENLIQQSHQNKHTKWDEDGNEIVKESSNQIVVSLGENLAELQDADDDDDDNDDDDDVVEVWSDSNGEEEMEVSEPDPVPIKTIKKKGDRTPKKKQETYDSDGDLEVVQEVTKEEKERMKKVETLVLDDSEEEETMTLTPREMETPQNNQSGESKRKRKKNRNKKKESDTETSKARGWYAKKAW